MREFRVMSGSGSFFTIQGSTLIEAIEKNFNRLHREFNFGNAAGYVLRSVKAEYREHALGGKGGVLLEVRHTGMDLAHTKASPDVKTTNILIYAAPEDLPTEPVFTIASL
ncbi:hypothetical protein [Paenibacillus sp. 1P03SA]|uniref:hypothetical protein n=1 Tax=Paenibacillus sp. 1P03SA TaxID=3132294 RepID=UPI0039A3570D